jgi:parvulin-like peptidyl-prolyl isomerase
MKVEASAILQVGKRTIAAEEIISLLAGYQLLPQLLRELVIDEAITYVKCTSEEIADAYQQFYEQNQLTEEVAKQAWLQRYDMTLEQLERLAIRKLKTEKFKQANWGHKLESYFLQRKAQLDKVIYSLLRIQNLEIAQELYFRIQSQEQSFAELAREYSLGPEAQTGGLIGPIDLKTLHPKLVQMLSISQPGQLWLPTRIGEWFVIVRLEKFLPVQLDQSMRSRLLNELFETWLSEQISQKRRVERVSEVSSK